MLTNIKLENFKCFKKLDLKCAPLTLLTGINGTGKSSVFQALLLLRQTKETQNYEAKTLVLDGPRLSLGPAKDIPFEGTKHIKYELHWEDEAFPSYDVQFQLSPNNDQLNPAYDDLDLEDWLVEFLWGTIIRS